MLKTQSDWWSALIELLGLLSIFVTPLRQNLEAESEGFFPKRKTVGHKESKTSINLGNKGQYWAITLIGQKYWFSSTFYKWDLPLYTNHWNKIVTLSQKNPSSHSIKTIYKQSFFCRYLDTLEIITLYCLIYHG